MRSTCLAIVQFEVRSVFLYFEVRVPYRRKKVHVYYLIS